MRTRQKETREPDDLSPLGNVLRVLEGLNPNLNREIFELWKAWDQIMGPELKGIARPSEFKKGVLLIKVEDPVWLQELTHKKEELLERLRAQVSKGLIKDIRLVLGKY
ncbi:MAG: DUF721 domain-containing protein [Desulfatiglandales bacterium]